MQLGFVIDHSRCIGCHACTIACKSENDVPVGSFRTWVKYTERGRFPDVRRSFAVLRCNQCTDAPCIEICPVHALKKRDDGIVDLDSDRCIGCKSCLQACPYDALYINDDTGTAEKCHFCAHRTERGLAPACAVICPTEAIIPGDFHDPASRVSQMKSAGDLTARKTEAATGPNVWYREVGEAGIDPLVTNAGRGYLWSDRVPGIQLDAQVFESLERKAEARTVYDVNHLPSWGRRVSGYLFTKSLAAGALLAAAPFLPPFSLAGGLGRDGVVGSAALALAFLLATLLLLVFDLKRPGRFLFILRYPNWNSWLTRGSVVLGLFGALAAAWLVLGWFSMQPGPVSGALLAAASVVAAAMTAMYTAWLFHQARGRVLWLRRGLAPLLLAHAVTAGSSLLLLVSGWFGIETAQSNVLRWMLVGALGTGLLLNLLEGASAPRRREEEYCRAVRLVTHGPFARIHRATLLFGIAVPLVGAAISGSPAVWITCAVLALAGLLVEQDTLVRAGQAPLIS